MSGDTAKEVAAALDGRELVVVSNRQPYTHEYDEGEVTVSPPAGGLTAALDPLLEEIGGTWVAWGSGDADHDVTDSNGRIKLPPETEAYDLRRVRLTDDEVEGYYTGYSNQMLWPICHVDTAKIDASCRDWRTYKNVNAKFADRVIEECDANSVVWFQDYHLALAPREVRRTLPNAILAHFWHIPWPDLDAFRACPQREQILDGLLANDLLGFHTETHCRNFLNCVEAVTDARVDRYTDSVVSGSHRTYVRSFPIGIDADAWTELTQSIEAEVARAKLHKKYDLSDTRIAVGVERLDYTKGIEQRLTALERFWEENPEWREQLTYIQKGTDSRSHIPAYQRLQERIESQIDALNDQFGTDSWQPVIYLDDMLSREELAALYREADLALVTPVRDGMNLVAKEFVAAQAADPGVLVLSELAGATEQLDEAVTVHPYDADGMADAIATALSMPTAERERRMNGLRQNVHENDVYAWLRSQFRMIRSITDDVESPSVSHQNVGTHLL